MRVTVDQNLVFRWVPVGDVRELYRRLAAASLGLAEAATVADVTSCPGAESCRLAVTQSRGLGRLLEDTCARGRISSPPADGAHIKISGCPNGCGQHHIATIGFQGSVRRVGGKAVPQYFVMVGGGADDAAPASRGTAAKIPARRIPEAVERLIAFYDARRKTASRRRPSSSASTCRASRRLLADLEQLTEPTQRRKTSSTLAETGEFTPEVMDGECSRKLE